jgi:hypothetical protein
LPSVSCLDTAHYLVTKHSRAARLRRLQLLQPEFTHSKCSSTESSVDDLGTCRGVVLSRAATILRSIETQPSTGGSGWGAGVLGRPFPHKGDIRHAKKVKNVRGKRILLKRSDVRGRNFPLSGEKAFCLSFANYFQFLYVCTNTNLYLYPSHTVYLRR